jgi:hypothetical protein
MNTRLAISLSAAAAGLGLAVIPVSSASSSPAPTVTGDVAWSTGLDYPAAADFVAMSTSPVRGSITVTNHDNVSFTGTVTCHHDLGDGETWFGGTITSSSLVDPGQGNVNGQSLEYFFVAVDDNGEPGNLAATTNPDRITVFRPDTAPTCEPGSLPEALMTANRPLTAGNLVVH